MAERPSDRAIDGAAVASGPTHDRQGIVAQLLDSTNIRELPNWVRVLMQRAADALDAAPSEPSAEHWRAALYEAREFQEWITTQQAEWIEQRAREIAREGK